LQSTVDYATDAITTPCGDDIELAKYEDHLAICLHHAWTASSSDEMLSLAIQQASSAVSRMDPQHPASATHMNHLVDFLKVGGEETTLQTPLI
jgi:hypothetical protein